MGPPQKQSNYDKNFAQFINEFKEKFGIQWNECPEAYIQFVQSKHVAIIDELLQNCLSQIIPNQRVK